MHSLCVIESWYLLCNTLLLFSAISTNVSGSQWCFHGLYIYCILSSWVYMHLVNCVPHRHSFRVGLYPPINPWSWTIFSKNRISIRHLLTIYSVIHNHLKIYYLHYPSDMLEDWIHWNVPTLIVILGHYIGTSWLCSVQQSALSSEGLDMSICKREHWAR